MKTSALLGALGGFLLLQAAGPAGAAPATGGPETAMPADVFTATGSYLAGLHAQQTSDWANAARFMERVLAHDPENPGLMRRAFTLHLGSGDTRKAVALARGLIEQEPSNQLAITLLVAENLMAGRLDRARQRLDSVAPDDNLGQFITPLLRAWLEQAAGKPEDALKALAPLAEIPGFRPLYSLQAALIHDLSGQTDKARALYEDAAANGATLRLVQLAANFHERQGRAEEARRLYQRFLDENPGGALVDPALSALRAKRSAAPLIASAGDGLAEALFDLASVLHQEGAGDLALLYGRIALHLRPDFAFARLMVGDILALRQRHEEAVDEYRQVMGDPAMRRVAQLRVAEQLQRLERDQEAAQLLEEMAAEQPDRLDALIALGDVHRRAERMEEATAAYSRAVERLGDNPEPRHWGLFYARGIAYERSQQWEKAEADLLRALELSPDQPYVLNYLGYSWVDRGENLERAEEMIRKAVELRPNDGYIVDSLGWVLYRLGDFEGAVRHLERAVELRPIDPTINDHLGDAYWQVGRLNEARFQWRRALAAAEDQKLAEDIRAKLERGLPRRQTAESKAAP